MRQSNAAVMRACGSICSCNFTTIQQLTPVNPMSRMMKINLSMPSTDNRHFVHSEYDHSIMTGPAAPQKGVRVGFLLLDHISVS